MADENNEINPSAQDLDENLNISMSEDSDIEINPDDYEDDLFSSVDDIDLLDRASGIYKIWSNWAYFQLEIISPIIPLKEVATIIEPEIVTETQELEFVYPIFDYGNIISTSKGSEMYSVGMSMCKFYYTIEKIIAIIIQKIRDSSGEDGNANIQEIESEVRFDGHQLGQRKAFESIINLNQNVVVTNFDPGEWGEKYLQIIKKLADRGYGFPPEAPRSNYRNIGSKISKIKP